MHEMMSECWYCKGEVTLQKITIDRRWKGDLYVIENVPAGVCRQCGEKYFTAHVSAQIDAVIQAEPKKVSRSISVPVLDLSMAS